MMNTTFECNHTPTASSRTSSSLSAHHFNVICSSVLHQSHYSVEKNALSDSPSQMQTDSEGRKASQGRRSFGAGLMLVN